MTSKLRSTLLCAGLALGVFGFAAAARQPSPPCPSGSDTIYVYENGVPKKQCYSGIGANGSRWVCIRGTAGCDPCAVCHSPTQITDRSYIAKYSAVAHRTVHFPRITATLGPSEKLSVSSTMHLRVVSGELFLTLNAGKDIALIPAGSTILLNQQQQPPLIALPTGGEPKNLP